MKSMNKDVRGFSLVELMVAMAIGLFLIGAVISVYLAQTQMYKSTTSQAAIQNAENAIAALVTPVVRSAGYGGCAALNPTTSLSVLNTNGPPPLSTMGSSANFLIGYDATGTAGSGSSLTIAQDNSVNDTSAGDWSPALDATLVGGVEAGSDVLVLTGAAPAASPVGVTTLAPAASTTMVLQDATGLTTGQYGIVSNCGSSSVFQITAISSNTITHAIVAGTMGNTASTLPVSYPAGAQFIPLQQTAFYVAQGQGSQSALVSATYSGGTWTAQPLVPGVESMQVLYGMCAAGVGVVTQYVAASAVGTRWAQVCAVRLGFLIQGQLGSGTATSATANVYPVLGTAITVPTDGRLRHVYEMTVTMRNAL